MFNQLREWAIKRSVTLRFKAIEACKLLTKETREETSGKDVCSISLPVIRL